MPYHAIYYLYKDNHSVTMKRLCVLVLIFLALVVDAQIQIRECTKAADCDPHECCIEGRHHKRFFLVESKGTCRALRKKGEKCDPFGAKSRDNPHLYVIECPCDPVVLTCQSSGPMATAHNSVCV